MRRRQLDQGDWPAGDEEPQSGRVAAVYSQIATVVIAVILQLWFLTVALDRFLSGDRVAPWILLGFSGVAFLVAIGTLVASRE